MFGKKPAHEIEEGAEKAGRKFLSNMTVYPDVDIDKELGKLDFDHAMKDKIREKYLKYYKNLKKYEAK